MNIPSVYRKAIDGFVIPPRSFFQMIISASKGAVSLFHEPNRGEFIEILDRGTINESVISQATAGPAMMLSLFHDLQNPLFRKYGFNATQFLEGVGPALEQFHNTSGALENQLRAHSKSNTISTTPESDEGSEETTTNENGSLSKEEKEAILHTIQMLQQNSSNDNSLEQASAVLNHDWMEDARSSPDSLAGQLSRMLTAELFDIHQLSAKTAFLLQPTASTRSMMKFQEGSCTVNNVALLSARAFFCVEKENEDKDETENDNTTRISNSAKYQIVDDILDHDTVDTEEENKMFGVAAQLEVLYDVTQHFAIDNDNKEKSTDKNEGADGEELETTVVSVATLEGWLQGGPEGELRWRLALHRPAFEFPGIQQAY